jgi:hypothetical protein
MRYRHEMHDVLYSAAANLLAIGQACPVAKLEGVSER